MPFSFPLSPSHVPPLSWPFHAEWSMNSENQYTEIQCTWSSTFSAFKAKYFLCKCIMSSWLVSISSCERKKITHCHIEHKACTLSDSIKWSILCHWREPDKRIMCNQHIEKARQPVEKMILSADKQSEQTVNVNSRQREMAQMFGGGARCKTGVKFLTSKVGKCWAPAASPPPLRHMCPTHPKKK
jgi:hypothetical protein